MTNPTYKVVAEKKFGFKKLLERLIGKRTLGQDQVIQETLKEWPEDLKVVVGKADEELLSGKSAVVEIGGFDGLALKKVMETYNQKYGRLPQEIYKMALEETAGYLKVVMEGYVKNGINTLSEIEAAIMERRPFVGSHAKGILEDRYYKIYVAGDLIYDGKEGVFDCESKRSSIYSAIQDMVAHHIYNKDVKTIRKESQ